MSRALTFEEVKAFTRQLIKAAGGVVPVATMLEVSHQQVSKYQNIGHADVMPFMSILLLQEHAGLALVTGPATRAIEGEQHNEIAAAVVASVATSAKTLRLVHDMDADGKRDAGEIRATQESAREQLDVAQRAYDAAMSLTPSSVAG
jgi:hypothetical protein